MRKSKINNIREEVSKEVNELVLEVLHRLERENPELLKSLFLTSEVDNISKSKNKSIKEPARKKAKGGSEQC